MSEPKYLSELDLSIRTFNFLRRERFETIEDVLGHLSYIAQIAKRSFSELCNKLRDEGIIPYAPGDYVEQVGKPLKYDDLYHLIGEMVVVDVSTESHTWYRVALITGLTEGGDERRVIFSYAESSLNSIQDVHFMNKPLMYSLKIDHDKQDEESSNELLPKSDSIQEIEEKARDDMKEFISIDSLAFSRLRDNFNDVMRDTLLTMQNKESTSASLTVKIDISLTPQAAGERTMIVPIFTHKVTSAIQMKEERSGKFGGRHELYYDELYKNFAMREIPPIDGQMDLPFV